MELTLHDPVSSEALVAYSHQISPHTSVRNPLTFRTLSENLDSEVKIGYSGSLLGSCWTKYLG